MKKTLIALSIIASSAISGSALAWSEGNFNGDINFGGDIQGTSVTWKWRLTSLTGINANFLDAVKEEDGVASVVSGLIDAPVTILGGLTTGVSKSATQGLSPVITFGDGTTAIVSPVGSTPETKSIRIDAHDANKRIGFFSFDFYPMAVILGEHSTEGKKVYAGVADPASAYGNGYFKYKSSYDAVGNEGFKNGIIGGLGNDAPDFSNFTASTSGVANVASYSSQESKYSNFQGAYAAIIKANSGKLRVYEGYIPTSKIQWSAKLPVTVAYM
ncbi:hypothetical protein RH63_18995 [Salmonella enterica]|nr:hypothetical protein [Salmonella enterica]EBP8096292.1 hypothetical protein [Salmonella enterica]